MTVSTHNHRLWLMPLLVLLAGWTIWSAGHWGQRDALVLYCAHDLVFAQQVIDDFTRETGIAVRVVGDTEANKSLGLVERILRERDQPVCDVFWNNQVSGTLRLQAAGVLEPYQGTGFQRIPEQFKDSLGYWTGFAARFRVWIVNTTAMPATQKAIQERLAGGDLSRMAVAIPIFGTTLSQYSLLWKVQGAAAVQDWHRSLEKRQCRFVSGNATVKNVVAEGICDFGMTDTDDYFVAVDDHMSVAMLPILVAERPICIPNSVALIKGSTRMATAKRLIDYLLSEAVEVNLARSAARQVPLGATDLKALPVEVQELSKLVPRSHDCRDLGPAQEACLSWLKQIYVP